MKVSVVLKLWVGGRQLSKQGSSHNRNNHGDAPLKVFFLSVIGLDKTIWARFTNETDPSFEIKMD